MKNHVGISFNNVARLQYSHLSAKAEDPAIENMIYRCFHGDGKSLFINQFCVNGLPKLIYNRIHHREITCHFYCFALAVVHSHHGRTIFIQIKTIRFGDDGLIQYLWNMRNPIHAKVRHDTVFLIIAYDIISPCSYDYFAAQDSAYFTGLNNGLVSGILAFTRTFLIQTVMILVLPLFLGTDGLWLAQAATELLAAVIAIAYFIARKREYCGPETKPVS